MKIDSLYSKVQNVIPPFEWEIHKPFVEKILKLKKERNAIILAHTYQSPEIYHLIADIIGDSLTLAKEARGVSADIIVMCGVKFMAETAKIFNPDKTVLIPDLRAGCSLANSITREDVINLKQKYPGVPVVSYVNTNADVKAETDICCTSANAVQVVESLSSDEVIFLPDKYLGKWVQTQTKKHLILWDGSCEVHERFTAQDIQILKAAHPDIFVLVHPECPPDVIEEADFVGSTTAMIRKVNDGTLTKVALITECTMADNVLAGNSSLNVIRPCNLCPHMKRINLSNVLESLQKNQFEITIPEDIRLPAYQSLEKMINV